MWRKAESGCGRRKKVVEELLRDMEIVGGLS